MVMMIVEEEGAVLGMNLGRPIVTDGDFVAQLCESDALFPSDYGRRTCLMLLPSEWCRIQCGGRALNALRSCMTVCRSRIIVRSTSSMLDSSLTTVTSGLRV